MKIKKKIVKNSRKGISLIVLVITIIVIIILAAAVIITLNKNNPIEEANRVRYESDVANMQAIFTNTVAKVMAVNQGSVKIKAGELNETKSGENSVVGEVEYTIENLANSNNTSGKIIFDNKENTNTEYYTGKKLPIYNAGNTIWYVDNEGTISLKVGEKTYGAGIQNSEGTGSGISQDEYNSLVSRIDKIEETIKSQGDRIYKLENETIFNKRESLLDEAKGVPCTSVGENVVSININLTKSIAEYKYLEIQADIHESGGNHTEKTNIISVNSLNYWNSNTENWSNESIFRIEAIVSNGVAYMDAIAWFKNENTLHIGYMYTNRENFKNLRIKKIYGIK